VIFVSIDDNEVAHLHLLLSEIFGEENLLGPLVWKRRTGSNDAQDNISVDHEYVMIARASADYVFGGVPKDFSKYKNPDNDPRGAWTFDNLTCNKTAQQRPNLAYSITDPETGITYEVNPNRVWAYERERMQRIIKEGKVILA
jgi:adenine-specific DNA-methyltransferase